jgi:glucokinase
VGGWAIAARAQEAARLHPRRASALVRRAGGIRRISSKSVEEAYYAGDPLAHAIVEETFDRLTAGLVSIVNAIDPQMIVLGGGVMEGFPSMFAPIRRAVRARGLRAAVKDLRIVPAGLGGSSGIVGSATLAMDAIGRR